MEIEPSGATPILKPLTTPLAVNVPSDGLLLYVAEASYESGTSPLSSWIPLMAYDDSHLPDSVVPAPKQERGSLDMFET